MGVLEEIDTSTSILLVDDNGETRGAIASILGRAGYVVYQASGSKEAAALLSMQRPDLIVTDIFMPEGDGFEIINTLRAQKSGIPVIVVSGGWSGTKVDFLKLADRLGAAAVLHKPFREEQLTDAVTAALRTPASAAVGNWPSVECKA